MLDLEKVSKKVYIRCMNSSVAAFCYPKKAIKYARKFSDKYSKINDFDNKLDLESICILFDKESNYSYIKCNLFTLTLKSIITIENVNISHERVITR